MLYDVLYNGNSNFSLLIIRSCSVRGGIGTKRLLTEVRLKLARADSTDLFVIISIETTLLRYLSKYSDRSKSTKRIIQTAWLIFASKMFDVYFAVRPIDAPTIFVRRSPCRKIDEGCITLNSLPTYFSLESNNFSTPTFSLVIKSMPFCLSVYETPCHFGDEPLVINSVSEPSLHHSQLAGISNGISSSIQRSIPSNFS